MTYMKNTIRAAALGLPLSLVMMASVPAMAGENMVKDDATCYASETDNNGNRNSCEVTASIEAPEGYALDVSTVKVKESIRGKSDGCSEPEIAYDGDAAVSATVTGKAMSDIIPNKGRAKVSCKLSAELVAL